jgi:hypothetical protein
MPIRPKKTRLRARTADAFGAERPLDKFTRSYMETALWSSTDNSDDTGGEPLDKNYSVADISNATRKEMIEDCKSFQRSEREDLAKVYATGHYDEGQAGHDFWLTRNGHGAGFWDRGLGAVGERLSEAARAYGSIDLMVSRGKIV